MPYRSELAALPAGARVVIRLPNGPDLASVLLTCFDRELVAVPLAPRGTDPAEIVRRVRASAVVERVAGEIEVRATGLPPEHPDAAGLAFIMFTSGSTGRPKGVRLSRRAVLGNAAKTAALHGISPDRPHGTCLPLYHCNALVMSLLGTHRTGAPLVLHSRFDPAGYFAALTEGGARTASIVPALLADLLDAAPDWPAELDYLITAAAPLTGDLVRRFHRTYGPRLRQGYGLTEAVNFSFTMPLLDAAGFSEQYLDRFPPVGEALPDTELRLESGEVQIRTPDLMDGYWEDPAATAEAVTDDGWLRTGDLGDLRDGLLVLHGRTKERINRGGEKHYPLEVERGWRADGLTGRFAAVGVAEPALGQEIGLVTDDAEVGVVQDLCERTALRPAVLRFGGFRATATGKPQRSKMGASLAARRLAPGRYERLLEHAALAARRMHADAPGSDELQALAALAPPTATAEDDVAFAAVDFVREHWTSPESAELAAAKSVWRAKLAAAWPLAAHVELAAEVAAAEGAPAVAVPFGEETTIEDGRLLVLPHATGTTTGRAPWALGPVWTFLTGGGTGHRVNRWSRLRRLRHDGHALVGCSVLRAGRHDLGGVIWARPTQEE
ncbi:fatty acid--CoA ligase family protein [Saccharopolyspora sp. NFXS83]|uniref:class I adenylate-forming enzyme family protein n=1 Tax=Saccharopolyspora sp. NFXS83 TaxID=2993560 RepID=UPI00224A58DC|nr:fatty acid--CoA ligase family protein [Saccharopolyspora sp. NFXS83]MCX2732706.1 fatty acid--CoA ligase family protein [Saccharopolyspora sp. NFXS83]